jgi:nucleoside-diphosphate-sugar epimerase
VSPHKRNIWILGGTGFIGTALVKHLSADRRNLLHLLVHKSAPWRLFENYNVFTGNLENFDISWLKRYPPDMLFHLARLAGSNNITRYLASKTGKKANQRLLSSLSEMQVPPVILYVSGSLMFGPQPNEIPADEKTKLSPVSYARLYIEGEKPILEAQQFGLMDIRIARPGWIVGAGSWFLVYFWDYFLKTGEIPLIGSGRQMMSLVHIDDCAGQIINLAENGAKGQDLNIFSSLPISMQNFCEILAGLLNTRINRISLTAFKSRYGKAAAEAFESSISLSTCYPDLTNRYQNKYGDPESMLLNVIADLEHKQDVLAETPKESPVEQQISFP